MARRPAAPELHTRARKRACDEVRRTERTCHLCGLPIDMRADHQRSSFGYTVDEIVPRSLGGSATDRANLRAAHRTCNSRRNDRPLSDLVYAECRAAMTPATTVLPNWLNIT